MTLTSMYEHKKDQERMLKLENGWFECENCKELIEDGAGHPIAPYRVCGRGCLERELENHGVTRDYYREM